MKRETQGLRKVESSMKERGEEHVGGVLHPKCRSGRRKVSSHPSLHLFFFSMVFFFFFPLYVFFFLLLEKKKMPSTSSFIYLFLFEANKVMAQMCCRLFSSSIFCCEQGDNNKLVAIAQFSFFLFEAKKMMGLSSSHFFFFSCCYGEQGNGSKLVAIAHFSSFCLKQKWVITTSLLSTPFFGWCCYKEDNGLLSPKPPLFFSLYFYFYFLVLLLQRIVNFSLKLTINNELVVFKNIYFYNA
jgi:hypothetical protein